MNPYRLAFLLSRAGFKAEVLSGYRGEPHNIIRKIAGGVLNLLTAIFPGQSIIIAPFFILYGKKS
jgi:hypothetical protein